jgi:hypothetical protein
MNTIRGIFIFAYLLTQFASAQDFVEEKPTMDLSFREAGYFEFGTGISTSILGIINAPLQGSGRVSLPALAALGEYRFTRQFALGLAFHFEEIRTRNIGRGSPPPNRVPIDLSVRYNAGIRFIWLPTILFFSEENAKKHDAYVGLRFGQTWFAPDLPSSVKKNLEPFDKVFGSDRFTTQFFLGYVRYFNNNAGIFAEFAAGSPHFFSAGIKIRK